MSRANALAHAARRVRAANERLPEPHRLNIAPDWQVLIHAIEEPSMAVKNGARTIGAVVAANQDASEVELRLAHAIAARIAGSAYGSTKPIPAPQVIPAPAPSPTTQPGSPDAISPEEPTEAPAAPTV